MKHDAGLAEVSPLQDPEPQRPELHLIQGGGEVKPDLHDPEQRPDFYVVPDPADPAEAEDDIAELSTRRQLAATQAGQVLRSVHDGKTVKPAKPKGTRNMLEDDYRHRGGGGGSALREYLKKIAAETHESECACYICRAP